MLFMNSTSTVCEIDQSALAGCEIPRNYSAAGELVVQVGFCEVRTCSTLIGEFVELECPQTVLGIEQAEVLAGVLLRAARLCRERESRPRPASLPLVEPFALEVAK